VSVYSCVIHVFVQSLFLGNHNCVAVISNYVPEEEVTCYTLPEANNKEPKLPASLAHAVHKFVMMVLCCRFLPTGLPAMIMLIVLMLSRPFSDQHTSG